MDSYIPQYVRDQAAPKSVQRLKKGRPFVRGIEERIHSETDYRGGIFKVVKTKRKNNLDSGIRYENISDLFYTTPSALGLVVRGKRNLSSQCQCRLSVESKRL